MSVLQCSIEPYVSPSQVVVPPPEPQPKDDFRERALMYMMDGVLEKLWHEEIKKPIPMPLCMVCDLNLLQYSVLTPKYYQNILPSLCQILLYYVLYFVSYESDISTNRILSVLIVLTFFSKSLKNYYTYVEQYSE